jgi:hypothetical protein
MQSSKKIWKYKKFKLFYDQTSDAKTSEGI